MWSADHRESLCIAAKIGRTRVSDKGKGSDRAKTGCIGKYAAVVTLIGREQRQAEGQQGNAKEIEVSQATHLQVQALVAEKQTATDIKMKKLLIALRQNP